MITLIHGDNIEASRKELIRLKKSYVNREIRDLNGQNLTAAELIQSLESSSLFGSDTIVFVENLISKRSKKKNEFETLAGIMKSREKTSECILWEEKEVSAGILKLFGSQIDNKLFKYPAVIFQILDNLRIGNAKLLLTLFDQYAAREAPELLFFLLVRRVRQLMMLRDGVAPEGLAPWQISRLTLQAKLFTMEQLIRMHTTLLTIDASIKQGKSSLSYRQSIQVFFTDMNV